MDPDQVHPTSLYTTVFVNRVLVVITYKIIHEATDGTNVLSVGNKGHPIECASHSRNIHTSTWHGFRRWQYTVYSEVSNRAYELPWQNSENPTRWVKVSKLCNRPINVNVKKTLHKVWGSWFYWENKEVKKINLYIYTVIRPLTAPYSTAFMISNIDFQLGINQQVLTY